MGHIIHKRINMKKIFLIVVFLTILLIFGCAASPKIYNKSVPIEQSSTIRIFNCNVRQFNGTNVLWGKMTGEKQLVIPAGTHSLELFYQFEDNLSKKLVSQSCTIEYQFVPGHVYVVTYETDFVLYPVRGLIFNETELQSYFTSNASDPEDSPLEGRWLEKNGKQEIQFSGNQYIFKDTKGKFMYRGYFSFDGKTISGYNGARFVKNQWVINKMTLFPMNNFTYNGEYLLDKNYQYKKVE